MKEQILEISLNGMVLDTKRLDKPEITLGRGSENDIVINNPAVSRHHATIFANVNTVVVVDAGSTNGTFVNNSRVVEKQLEVGDDIIIGKMLIKYKIKDVDFDEDTVIDLAFQSESDVAAFPDGTFMVNEQDKQKILDKVKSDRITTMPILVARNREFQINNNHFTIGKSTGNNLKVNGWFVKNLHANIIRLNPKTYKIISYGSFLAPTKVNGASVSQKILDNGDVIEVGNTKMVYQH
ncbi:MAG: FHA domain-containing protein [Candidatus Dadabacteria bacterium]|nr:FHA domain-containing protein [Candidatus Dadabacteria bacterium]NIX15556.1 FHA domain-containing protein [Candidatus Dadabacteria bacterium]NIY22296.1 FHA domain-containing protein [Candidatus Dadabacteria bacterium]